MAFEIPGFNRSWVAGGTVNQAGSDMSIGATLNSIVLPNLQYLFVAYVAGLVLPVNASGSAYKDLAVGVLQNKPAPGQPCTVQISGVSRVVSNDATIVPGSLLYVDAYGMVTSVSGGGTSTHACGIAESVAAASGGYVVGVLLKPMGVLA